MKRKTILTTLTLLSIIVLAVFPSVNVADAQPFRRVAAITLNPSASNLQSAAIDSRAGFAYFGTSCTYTGVFPKTRVCGFPGIVKVKLSDMSRVGNLTLSEWVRSAVIDTGAGFAYFGVCYISPCYEPGLIVKVRLSDFTRLGILTLNMNENGPGPAVIDPIGGYAYFGARNSSASNPPDVIVKVEIAPHPIGPLDMLRLWSPFIGLALGISAAGAAIIILVARHEDKKRVSLTTPSKTSDLIIRLRTARVKLPETRMLGKLDRRDLQGFGC